MNAVVIYESLTGNTRRAAEAIGRELAEAGIVTTVCNVTDLDFRELALADLVVVGSWTDGIFLFGQRPGRAHRLQGLPPITGKKCAVYCTFALDPGKTLEKLQAIMEERGAEVLGGMTIKRTKIDEGAKEFAGRLLAAVTT